MKFALCNEVFQDFSIEKGFSKIAEIGYKGVEIAPFTLKEDPLEINEEDAIRCANAAKSAGLEIVGLHWLMAKTEGLHLTHSDQSMRLAASNYLKKLTTVFQMRFRQDLINGIVDKECLIISKNLINKFL